MYLLSAYTNYIDSTLTKTSNCAFYFSKYPFNLLIRDLYGFRGYTLLC